MINLKFVIIITFLLIKKKKKKEQPKQLEQPKTLYATYFIYEKKRRSCKQDNKEMSAPWK